MCRAAGDHDQALCPLGQPGPGSFGHMVVRVEPGHLGLDSFSPVPRPVLKGQGGRRFQAASLPAVMDSGEENVPFVHMAAILF